MHRTIFTSLVGLFFAAIVLPGCEPSRAEIICDLTCACEHCNDQVKLELCNALETAQNVANVYGCSNAWEAYTSCVEKRGTCDETEARFTLLNDINENRCQDESDALDACIADASAHEGVSTDFN